MNILKWKDVCTKYCNSLLITCSGGVKNVVEGMNLDTIQQPKMCITLGNQEFISVSTLLLFARTMFHDKVSFWTVASLSQPPGVQLRTGVDCSLLALAPD